LFVVDFDRVKEEGRCMDETPDGNGEAYRKALAKRHH
jgi:hypothetical protein